MDHHEWTLFFLQISVMLIVALFFGKLMLKCRQPAVLGELIGGIILGPTVFGALAPDGFGWLFPPDGAASICRGGVVKLGMLFFLLVAGMEVNLALVRRHGRGFVTTSIFGMVVPFVLGYGLVMFLPGVVGLPAGSDTVQVALFMGTALSISALPVIARILMDLDLMKTDLGVVVIASAMLDDLVGWLLFGFILAAVVPGSSAAVGPWMKVAIVVALFAVVLTAGRWAGRRLVGWMRSSMPWPGGFIGMSAVMMLLVAGGCELAGIHAALGAFLVGVVLAPPEAERSGDHDTIYQFVTNFFGAPLYFVSIGLGVNFLTSFDVVLVLAVVLVACVGKIGGAGLGARLGGMPGREALAVGFGMNARGAMGMILASVALEHGIIDERVFVALIVMALVTSILSGPAMKKLMSRDQARC